jgi:hypothetical protein
MMMQTLLEERFRLAVHREKVEMPVYLLIPAKALEVRGLGSISINVRITAVRKLAVEAADNGLMPPGSPPASRASRESRPRACAAVTGYRSSRRKH